ncbi:hypothetical protein [Sphingomonas sp. 3-13AW]|uniref:hypothetical protein n=1 Tax=Sphingomonas sp. 3-13AW TaxID=3050450 RepID=UPI003BB707EF
MQPDHLPVRIIEVPATPKELELAARLRQEYEESMRSMARWGLGLGGFGAAWGGAWGYQLFTGLATSIQPLVFAVTPGVFGAVILTLRVFKRKETVATSHRVEVLAHEALPVAKQLIAALETLHDAVADETEEGRRKLMEASLRAAPLIEELNGAPLRGIPDSVVLNWVGSPIRTARGLQDSLEWLIGALSGRIEPPPTPNQLVSRIGSLMWPWRTVLQDRGIHVDVISNSPKRLSRRRTPDLIASGDLLSAMAQRLDDQTVLERVRSLVASFEAADTRHFDEMTIFQTRALVDRHLPDLARRFVTAFDTSSESTRPDTVSMAQSSLELVENSLTSTMARHAASAQNDLDTQRRFLEARLGDPWEEAAQ